MGCVGSIFLQHAWVGFNFQKIKLMVTNIISASLPGAFEIDSGSQSAGSGVAALPELIIDSILAFMQHRKLIFLYFLL